MTVLTKEPRWPLSLGLTTVHAEHYNRKMVNMYVWDWGLSNMHSVWKLLPKYSWNGGRGWNIILPHPPSFILCQTSPHHYPPTTYSFSPFYTLILSSQPCSSSPHLASEDTGDRTPGQLRLWHLLSETLTTWLYLSIVKLHNKTRTKLSKFHLYGNWALAKFFPFS
jgi:hypothetical protein